MRNGRRNGLDVYKRDGLDIYSSPRLTHTYIGLDIYIYVCMYVYMYVYVDVSCGQLDTCGSGRGSGGGREEGWVEGGGVGGGRRGGWREEGWVREVEEERRVGGLQYRDRIHHVGLDNVGGLGQLFLTFRQRTVAVWNFRGEKARVLLNYIYIYIDTHRPITQTPLLRLLTRALSLALALSL
jgi:hypothetical protein